MNNANFNNGQPNPQIYGELPLENDVSNNPYTFIRNSYMFRPNNSFITSPDNVMGQNLYAQELQNNSGELPYCASSNDQPALPCYVIDAYNSVVSECSSLRREWNRDSLLKKPFIKPIVIEALKRIGNDMIRFQAQASQQTQWQLNQEIEELKQTIENLKFEMDSLKNSLKNQTPTNDDELESILRRLPELKEIYLQTKLHQQPQQEMMQQQQQENSGFWTNFFRSAGNFVRTVGVSAVAGAATNLITRAVTVGLTGVGNNGVPQPDAQQQNTQQQQNTPNSGGYDGRFSKFRGY